MDNLQLINGQISVKEAHEMVKAYDQANPGKTKSVWFSLDRVEDLLMLLHEDHLNNLKTNGIRIYFGQYPADYDSPKEWAGRDTILFVSTYEDGNINRDYFRHIRKKEPILPFNKGEICPPPSDCGNNGSLLLDPNFNPTDE